MKKFLIWLGAMAVLLLINSTLGLWAIVISLFLWGHDGSDEKSSRGKHTRGSLGEDKPYRSSGVQASKSGHVGSSYNAGGDVKHYPGGNSSVQYDNVTYFSNKIHSVNEGKVTYYFDESGRRLGRSVDQGNGVHIYFDDDGRQIGQSYTSGRITDFLGDCFECR